MSRQLKLFDSLTKNLILLPQQNISLYVCGITPYDNAHAGHGRCYIVYDVLLRLIRWNNRTAQYVRNITDVDDKLINKAEDTYKDPSKFSDLAEKYYRKFILEIDKLNCIRPDIEPRVTENIENIITFIEELLHKQYAYVSADGVYFDISKLSTYGALSGRCIEGQCAGARIDVRENKKNPFDFALWKFYNTQPTWNSPWGLGRPGWHIECSAMIDKTLGKSVTIHGGGNDLLFPHHENERAQSYAKNNVELARIWMHTAFVTVKDDKMSKSLGNMVTLEEIINRFHPMAFRLYVLNNHYRSPLSFSFETLESFEKMYIKLIKLFYPLLSSDHDTRACKHRIQALNQSLSYLDDLMKLISEDMNTAACIGYIFKNEHAISQSHEFMHACFVFLEEVCGIQFDLSFLSKSQSSACACKNIDETIACLIREREEARAQKDFAKADLLRKKLQELGYEIQDKKIEKK